MLLFSYGSNHPKQLAERLGHAVDTAGAFLPGFKRVFCGYSNNWHGGVASVVPGNGNVFGLVCEVNARDLATMDRYEGVASGHYSRKTVMIRLADGSSHKAVVYVSNNTTTHKPSRRYLEAVAKTVGAHWRNDDGSKVTWQDITVRPCESARENPKRNRLSLFTGTA